MQVPHYQAVLQQKDTVGVDAYEYTFSLTDTNFRCRPGQYIWMLQETLQDDPRGDRRAFSVTSDTTHPENLSIVFRASASRYKQALLAAQIGDVLTMIGPFGSTFVLNPQDQRPLVCIAGGVGVAPFLSILRSSHNTFGHPVVIMTFDHHQERQVSHEQIQQETTRLGIPLLSQVETFSLAACSPYLDIKSARYYICGAQWMVNRVGADLQEAGIPQLQQYYEQFFPQNKGVW